MEFIVLLLLGLILLLVIFLTRSGAKATKTLEKVAEKKEAPAKKASTKKVQAAVKAKAIVKKQGTKTPKK
jgi:predicted PurR-regulated permease PerM